ncbi:MAG: peptidase T [Eubacteriales bacterium]|nr:peptidase T [Eubacteriales bacterium]
MNVKERFLRYVAIDSGSSEETGTTPSTEKQWEMGRLLEKELKELGASNVRLSEFCYVYAEIPANVDNQPAIGLIAHMDTAAAVPTGPVHARCVVYQGGELEVGNGYIMNPESFECLKKHVGHELVLTDGTTLLGADDKAGVAEIMALCEELLTHPEIKHGKICIGFTPDEEIGEGSDHFDVAGFGADFAYTVDGGAPGELECENFNACSAVVNVHGFNIHPGSAKDKMVNAARIAMVFASLLPQSETPEHTENREGFYHLNSIKGDEVSAQLRYIVRDHDWAKFEARKEYLRGCAALMNVRFGEGTVELELKDSYYNMKEKIDEHPEVIERAFKAFRAVGDEPVLVPIRGGTDGARLSYEGLPCPNLPTGGYNIHGVMEYASIPEMEKNARMLVELVRA